MRFELRAVPSPCEGHITSGCLSPGSCSPPACRAPAPCAPLQLKDKQPTLTLGEVGKATGEAWGKLSDKDKEPYAKKAEKAKAE